MPTYSSPASAWSTCSPSSGGAGAERPRHDGDRDGAGLGAAVRQQLPRRARGRAAAAESEPDARAATASCISSICRLTAPKLGLAAAASGAATAPSISKAAAGSATTARSGSRSTAGSSGRGSAIRLARPNEALGLSRHAAEPRSQSGRLRLSRRGRIDAGAIHQRRHDPAAAGQPATIEVAALNVRARATGALRADPGGFTGRLRVTGGGLDGSSLRPGRRPPADRGRLRPPTTRISPGRRRSSSARGRLEGVVLLDPAGTSVEGALVPAGLSRGPLAIASSTPRPTARRRRPGARPVRRLARPRLHFNPSPRSRRAATG